MDVLLLTLLSIKAQSCFKVKHRNHFFCLFLAHGQHYFIFGPRFGFFSGLCGWFLGEVGEALGFFS
jgi:hypothetical protein